MPFPILFVLFSFLLPFIAFLLVNSHAYPFFLPCIAFSNVMLLINGNRSFDESTWGAFDNNDDVDSVWGFNTTKVTHSF